MSKYAVIIKTYEELVGVVKQANSEGVTRGISLDGTDKYRSNLQRGQIRLFLDDSDGFISWSESNTQGAPEVTFQQYAAIKNISLYPSPVTFKLTDSYDAVVNYEKQTVQVGCQTIPFAKVIELYNLTQATV